MDAPDEPIGGLACCCAADELFGGLVRCCTAGSSGVGEPEQGPARSDPPSSSLSEDEAMVDVVAPPGRLGLIMDTRPSGGLPYVCEVKDGSPVKDKVCLQDRFVRVDGEDVSGMSAVEISKLLARKSRQPERKISVARKRLDYEEKEIPPAIVVSTASVKKNMEDEDKEIPIVREILTASTSSSSEMTPTPDMTEAEDDAFPEGVEPAAPSEGPATSTTTAPDGVGPRHALGVRGDLPPDGGAVPGRGHVEGDGGAASDAGPADVGAPSGSGEDEGGMRA